MDNWSGDLFILGYVNSAGDILTPLVTTLSEDFLIYDGTFKF